MATFTPRSRVLTALNHEEPDRVPTALWGGPYGLVDELYLRLLELLRLGAPVEPFREGHNITHIDDRVLDALGTDTRYVWPGASPSSPYQATDDPNVIVDGYGQPWHKAFPYYYPAEGILINASSIGEIDTLVTWPNVDDPQWVEGVRNRARFLHEETDYFVIARMVTSHGPFQTASDLRGTTQFLLDLSMDPDFATTLIDRVTDTIVGLMRNYLRAAGDFIDMIELPGDDYASNNGLIISPKMFRQFFKPALKRLVDTAKGLRPDLKVMFHSDGMVTSLIPDLIDIGVDVLHPIEPVQKLDQAAIKKEYGDHIAFLGGIDISHAMSGSRQDVEDEAKRRIDLLGAGGGYILAPANHLQGDVPPENVVTLYNTAHQYGSYPLETAT